MSNDLFSDESMKAGMVSPEAWETLMCRQLADLDKRAKELEEGVEETERRWPGSNAAVEGRREAEEFKQRHAWMREAFEKARKRIFSVPWPPWPGRTPPWGGPPGETGH